MDRSLPPSGPATTRSRRRIAGVAQRTGATRCTTSSCTADVRRDLSAAGSWC
ncbi:hypothetical protein HBB16_10375 [Pseudonocardia sp. MCCB 268]|nr:hypothetical protein [Pseudonocardia cytotoxica]